MAKLEELVQGASVLGIDPNGPVTIIAVEWYDEDTVNVTWKSSTGKPDHLMFSRKKEQELSICANALPWPFDADGAGLRLVSEAWRIKNAYLFDPYLAVHSSNVQPLPHQISAVYEEMLKRIPLRFVLADDPGAGKTIMTGLFIRELVARGDLERCLIVCPGSLAYQWQDELYRKFHLHFEIISREKVESSITGNIFMETPLAIARMDMVAWDESLREKLKVTDWDLIVVDEAHKMSAHAFGKEMAMSKRFRLGKILSGIANHFLLLTATPHNGKEQDFQFFLSLVDPDRFGGAVRRNCEPADISDIMRRLVKEDLLKFDGKPLFPERHAETLKYDLSAAEYELYEAVSDYVREQFNQADNLDNKRRNTVGFALTILQRRLASSPEAIYQSLKRRREKLEKILAQEKFGKSEKSFEYANFDEDELTQEELEQVEEEIVEKGSASSTIPELTAEIGVLAYLESMAHAVRASGRDRKWEQLSGLLQTSEKLFDESGKRKKLIIFTEHRDTLRYLVEKIASLLGDPEAVVMIHGSMNRDERRKVEALFMQDKNVRVLVATDAAGEGLNLQRAHLMVNYDLPWNPNRLEQRFGRIHRIGQTGECWLWNLVADKTREGAVFDRLFSKLEQERKALGGKVFDILGKVSFNNRPLRELLIEAIRRGKEKQNAISDVIDSSINTETFLKLMEEHALTQDIMNPELVAGLRQEMERREARRLQPYFIETFFREAFAKLDGRMDAREKGRYEISHVPAPLRKKGLRSGRVPVLARYERVCFDKAFCNDSTDTSLLCPGHPLLDAVLATILEKYGDILKRGAILIDENDPSENLRLLFYIDSVIVDGRIDKSGNRRIISRKIHFVELSENGEAANAGYAPYLDYRPPGCEEQEILLAYAKDSPLLQQNTEKKVKIYAVKNLAPAHLEETAQTRIPLIEKTRKAVIERLDAEIRHFDKRAAEFRQQEKEGKPNAALNALQATRSAEELVCRKKKRLDELDREQAIDMQAPVITGAALIAPAGLLRKLANDAQPAQDAASSDPQARKAIELAAINAVMKIEKELGYVPENKSDEKCGYDIESFIPEHLRPNCGSAWRFIEVKGRVRGADTVSITHNEVLFGLTAQEQYILALTEVDGDYTHTIYLKKPFKNPPDYAVESSRYNISALLQSGEKIFEG